MNFLKMLIPVTIACLCNASANTFWKIELAKNKFTISNVTRLIFSYNIIIGIFCYGVSMLIFFYLLSNYKLSAVVPLTGLTYIFNMLSAYFIFNEKLSIYSIVGTLFVIIGVIILQQSPINN